MQSFWNYFNYKEGGNQFPSCMSLGDVVKSEPSGIAELFALHFASVFERPVPDVPTYPLQDVVSLGSIHITREAVSRGLDHLDIGKGMGPDGVPPILLRQCSETLSYPLTSLFNKSLQSGHFPASWKTSYITPIPKAGDRSIIQHYRPICSLSTTPKLLEKLVVEQLAPQFSSFICQEQHGFLRGRSTTSNLMVFQDFVLDGFSKGFQTDAISTDYAKAFDRLSHNHLLSLLASLGVHGPFLTWMQTYLCDRKLIVRVKGHLSSPFLASSGIPQGSHLGPLCFLLMINSVVERFGPGVKCLLFADDLKVFCHIKSPSDCRSLQSAIDELEAWCDRNSLQLNPSKCSVTSFYRASRPAFHDYSLCGSPLRRSSTVTDLGVLLDAQLTFSNHIEMLAGRAMRALGFVRRHTREFTSIPAIVALYKALVLPIMEYASTVWSPAYSVHKYRLERVQNKFLRYVAFKQGIPSADIMYDSLLRKCHLTTLENRRCSADLAMLYKILNGVVDCPALLSSIGILAPRTTSRSPLLFHVPFSPTNYQQNRPLRRLPRSANLFLSINPDFDFFHSSLSTLKSIISSSPISYT